ncbi:MAG TPA: hypothetical protein VGN37_02140 [Actinocatenispora sp.]
MSQPGFGPGGPYPPDNNNPQQPGWGGGQPNNQPPSDPYGQPYGQPAQPGYGEQPPPPGPAYGEQPPAAPGYGEQQPPAAPGYGYGEQPPTSGAPGFGPPVSGPATPASGPGYGAPVSGGFPPPEQNQFGDGQQQHTTVMPTIGAGGPPLPANRFASNPGERKRGPWIPVLAAAAAVFLILAGTMTVLYVGKSGDLTSEKKVAADRQGTIDDQKSKLDDLNKQLDDTKKERDKAKQDLSGAQNKNTDLSKQRDIIAKCLSLLEQAIVASGKGDEAKTKKLLKELDKPCKEADQYLN